MKLILYTGPKCSLCDKAQALLLQVSPSMYGKLDKVFVHGDAELYHKYGARIPVLLRTDTHAELGWPFDAANLELFLK